MISEIQYCTDTKGNKLSVIIPIKDWDKIIKQNQELQTKISILTGIQDAFAEVKESKKTGKKMKSLAEFINENRS